MSTYREVLQEYAKSGPYDLEELVDRGGVLQLYLIGVRNKSLRIEFDSYIAYRKIDEGDAMVTLSQLATCGKAGKSFYQVASSEFVSWLLEQGYGVRSSQELLHYVVVTVDDIIDVISHGQPSVFIDP